MEANNINKMREALSDIIDRIDQWRNDGSIEHWQYSQLFDIADAALASSPRACDLMTEEELSRVVSRAIVASVSSRPELNEEWIKSLVVAAVTAAIKCAYDRNPASASPTALALGGSLRSGSKKK